MRNGVSPSCVALPSGAWATVLDFLAERLSAVSRDQWQHRMAQAQVLNANGQAIPPEQAYTPNSRVFYYRDVGDEPELPFKAQVLFQDAHVVVADKPHFMPVTPSGRYVQQSLLVQLKTEVPTTPCFASVRYTRSTKRLPLKPH
jgi:tRNA pseudouridine32 synthase/23S rRNA pseudouridine746 synthase